MTADPRTLDNAALAAKLAETRGQIVLAQRALAMFSATCRNTDQALALLDEAIALVPVEKKAAEPAVCSHCQRPVADADCPFDTCPAGIEF